jgi:hypothetical protein
MNWYKAGLPRMALNGTLISATSKRTLSVGKLSAVPNVTRREMQPCGIIDTGPTPKNGRDSWSFPISICSFLKAARLMRLRTAPPSIKTCYILTLEIVGELPGAGHALGAVRGVKPNQSFHPLAVWCYFRCRGHRCNLSTQSFDDVL